MKKMLFIVTLIVFSAATCFSGAVSASSLMTTTDSVGRNENPTKDGLLLSQQESKKSEEEDLSFLQEDQDKEMPQIVPDPLYYFNKGMYHVNDKL